MNFQGLEIRRFFIMDMDNLDNPQEMLKNPKFYQAPDDPHFHLGASQMRDMMNIVSSISARIGGHPRRIEWCVELQAFQGLVIQVTDFNDLEDD